ncbi:hypothetical protein D5R40_32030 [Okeania hirsuta]|uniref:Uncharacterized protein n=1 Tax=Okeania hirsuta TaxID=1458930 RepID=A0A3N6NSP5_9CYAN|nr:hypothetical protein D5R40_32030 [Okeania hirsuta]
MVQYKGKLFFIAEESRYGEEIWYVRFWPQSCRLKGGYFWTKTETGVQDNDEVGIPRVSIRGSAQHAYTFTN